MIELAMLFALGFLAASLLALLALPIVSGRARRHERLSVERRLPLSLAEIAAERDQIRAVHAVALRQAEQRAEAFEPRLAAAMAEAGRHAAALAVAAEERRAREAALADLQASLADATGRAQAAVALVAAQGRQLSTLTAAEAAAQGTIAHLAAEAAQAEARAREAEATASAQRIALNDLAAQADREAGHSEAVTARLAASAALVEEQRAALAGLELHTTSLQDRPPAGPPIDDGGPLRAALARLRTEQSMMSKTVAAATGERDRLRLRVDQLLLQIEDLQAVADAAEDGASAGPQAGSDEAVAILTSRLAAREAELAAAHAHQAEPGAASSRDEASLRLAIAALAAELVRHATDEPTIDAP